MSGTRIDKIETKADGYCKETYSVDGHCANCGQKQSLTFGKGEPANGTSTCRNCGCNSVVVNRYHDNRSTL